MNLRLIISLTIFTVHSLSANLAVAHGQHKSIGERIKLSHLSTYKAGPYDKGAAEIASFDPLTQTAFTSNNHRSSIDAISLAKPELPTLDFSINLSDYGDINSVAVKNSLVAVAVSAKTPQENGTILIFNSQGKQLNSFTAGAMPDMVTFSPNGKHILSANEGEPNDDYSIDPEGSITIIDIDGDVSKLTQTAVRTANFSQFTRDNIDSDIRVFGQNASVAQDLEPEYISVSGDSKTAWVSLQENNAIAEVSIEHGQVKKIYPLGYQDHSLQANALDVSDKDGQITVKPWPVKGMYQPDSIASYEVDGQVFIVTANEGDERNYSGFSEEQRVSKMSLEPALKTKKLQNNDQLGRLKVSIVGADTDQNGLSDTLYSFGSRSFSIWDQNLKQVYDSGNDFERITARDYPKLFNAGDLRSDDKGPEPEALAIGKVGDSTYAFIGLERSGGVMVYNITTPEEAFFVDYLNTISPSLDPSDSNAGDIAPESLVFVGAVNSPNGRPFLISANQVSGTVSVYAIDTAEPKDRYNN